MVANHPLHGNSRDILLVLVVALFACGLGARAMVGTEINRISHPTPSTLEQATTSDLGQPLAETAALESAPPVALATEAGALHPEAAPTDRFMGEGVGRKGPVATSSGDKRAQLLHATAQLHRRVRTRTCDLTDRQRDGTLHPCTTAAEQSLAAVSPGVGD